MKRNEDIKGIIDYFKAREEVSALYLFGSVAKGTQNAGSDIDIAVLVDEKKLRGKRSLPCTFSEAWQRERKTPGVI